MGYQESLIYIQPQEQVGQIVKEYLMARQQAPSGRVRKYYRLTRRGRQLLDDKKKEWEAFRQGVGDVLSGGANALA